MQAIALAPARAQLGDTVLFPIPPRRNEDGRIFRGDEDIERRLRPAVIVRDWNGDGALVNLKVFLDGSNDAHVPRSGGSGSYWATSVHPGTGEHEYRVIVRGLIVSAVAVADGPNPQEALPLAIGGPGRPIAAFGDPIPSSTTALNVAGAPDCPGRG